MLNYLIRIQHPVAMVFLFFTCAKFYKVYRLWISILLHQFLVFIPCLNILLIFKRINQRKSTVVLRTNSLILTSLVHEDTTSTSLIYNAILGNMMIHPNFLAFILSEVMANIHVDKYFICIKDVIT